MFTTCSGLLSEVIGAHGTHGKSKEYPFQPPKQQLITDLSEWSTKEEKTNTHGLMGPEVQLASAAHSTRNLFPECERVLVPDFEVRFDSL